MAAKLENDPSLTVEIAHYHVYCSEVRRCATEMARLRRDFLKACQDVHTSLTHLAATNAHMRLEPRVLHDLANTQELPAAVRDDALTDFANTWKETSEVTEDRCQWCENKGHDTWECCYLTRCVYCDTYGHLDTQCCHPHDKCVEKDVCNVVRNHINWDAYCPSKICTYRA